MTLVLDKAVNDRLQETAEALNDVFRAAGLRHYIAAVPSDYEGTPSVQIVYASGINMWGTLIQGGIANLKGADRARLSRAFNKTGTEAHFYKGSWQKGNAPVLAIARMPDDDPYQYMHLVRGRIHPYMVHLLRADPEYVRGIGSALAEALKKHFTEPDEKFPARGLHAA